MPFKIAIKKKVEKGLGILPEDVQAKLWVLVLAMQRLGPVRGDWPNYSKLGETGITVLETQVGCLLAFRRRNFQDRGGLCW
jgi:hypothetical protein